MNTRTREGRLELEVEDGTRRLRTKNQNSGVEISFSFQVDLLASFELLASDRRVSELDDAQAQQVIP